ncbi:PIN domain-containing protein [Luteolibacter soli]|uniref:Ribonuclease VapC n=1 Tax=Luteolibacter soli TaxID=3135280 RepID=A0ABU9AZ79_9BACT
MNYLLDVNVLVAWGWADHADHKRVVRWIASTKSSTSDSLVTSSIPELGFVRVSLQRAAGRLTVEDAVKTLQSMIGSLGGSHAFLPDDQSSTMGFANWCAGASRTTDAHLLALAARHGAELATLDLGIPGAFVIPSV